MQHSITTSIRLSLGLRQQLELAAQTLHRGKNWIITKALEEYLEKMMKQSLALKHDEEIWPKKNDSLDEQLIKTGLEVTGLKTKQDLIDHALREVLRYEEQKKILELKGKVSWNGNLEISRKGRNN